MKDRPLPLRERLLRLCLYAYPPACRRRDGRAIIDLAKELAGRSRMAFLREAGGLLAGGMQARARAVRSAVADAPWRGARERLALPLAVALLCLFVAFAFPVRPEWIGWWALLALLAAAGAVVGAAVGRPVLTTRASLVLLVLMAYDAFRELTAHSARWTGEVVIGEVNMLGMWLPAALLLVICAGAVGHARVGTRRGHAAHITRRRHPAWTIFVPVGLSIALAVIARGPWGWEGAGPGRSVRLLGVVFVYGPLLLAAFTAARGIIRNDPVAKTAAALLTAGCCLPVLWLLAMVIGEPPVSAQYLPFIYYGPGIALACLLAWGLIRRRDPASAQGRASTSA